MGRLFQFLGQQQGYQALNQKAGNFGDQADIDAGTDNGVSAWSYRYIDNPGCLGLALPVQFGGDLHPYAAAFVPFTGNNHAECTKVRILSHDTGMFGDFVFVDKGPAASTGRAVDLLPATVKALGLRMAQGVYSIDAWILPAGSGFIGIYPASLAKPPNMAQADLSQWAAQATADA